MPDTVLAGCYVISLRPAGQHEPLRRAAARHGARVLALSPWRLAPRDDAATRAALETALACAAPEDLVWVTGSLFLAGEAILAAQAPGLAGP
jgi:uroporphyrinogen-III synthase